MSEKEKEICEFEMHLKNFFVCALKTRSENGYEF